MKYWLFDGSDIIGPFSLQELAGKRGFSSSSLVCPDGFSDQADHWQLASTFAELQPVLNGEPIPEEKPQTPAETPVEVDETPTNGDASLRLPLTPGKAGPIEEYFNTIKGEDLGNILGIPDPNENTDADLARVIESELVNLPDKEVYEPFHQPVADAAKPAPQPVKQTPAPKTQGADTKPAAAPQQAPAKPVQPAPKNTQAPAQKAPAPKPAQGAKKQNAGPAKPAAQPAKQGSAKQPAPAASKSAAPQSAHPKASTNKPAAAQPAPAKKQPAAQNKPAAKDQVTSQTITKGDVEIEKFDTGRQEVDFSDYSDQLNSADRPEEQTPAKPVRSQWLMAVLACLLLFVLVNLLAADNNYTDEIICAAKNFVQDILPARFTGSATAALADTQAPAAPQEQPLRSVADTLLPAQPVSAALLPSPNEETDLRSPYAEPENDESTDLTVTDGVPLTPAQTALLAVQNYQLPNGRGNIKDYLQNYYAPQFDKGYEADWSVALLHKNIYIVQYRLTKTRTEPIVYVFQADGEKGLLTGALNNITLDLVGKIQQ